MAILPNGTGVSVQWHIVICRPFLGLGFSLSQCERPIEGIVIEMTVNILFQLYARHADYLQALVGQEFEIVSNAITHVVEQ